MVMPMASSIHSLLRRVANTAPAPSTRTITVWATTPASVVGRRRSITLSRLAEHEALADEIASGRLQS